VPWLDCQWGVGCRRRADDAGCSTPRLRQSGSGRLQEFGGHDHPNRHPRLHHHQPFKLAILPNPAPDLAARSAVDRGRHASEGLRGSGSGSQLSLLEMPAVCDGRPDDGDLRSHRGTAGALTLGLFSIEVARSIHGRPAGKDLSGTRPASGPMTSAESKRAWLLRVFRRSAPPTTSSAGRRLNLSSRPIWAAGQAPEDAHYPWTKPWGEVTAFRPSGQYIH
jgi:hypothetical protein